MQRLRNISRKFYGLRRLGIIPYSTKHERCKTQISKQVSNMMSRSVIAQYSHDKPSSEGGYGINTQVKKSKKMTTINFMGYDLNKLF